MTQEKKDSFSTALKPLKEWLKLNAMTIIAFLSLSWQISSKVSRATYGRISNFVDSAESVRLSVRLMEREFSSKKIEQHITDNRQDSSISKLIIEVDRQQTVNDRQDSVINKLIHKK